MCVKNWGFLSSNLCWSTFGILQELGLGGFWLDKEKWASGAQRLWMFLEVLQLSAFDQLGWKVMDCLFRQPIMYEVSQLYCLQVTAFFLAVIFGMFGTANFYIGRLDCAIPQLVLFTIAMWSATIYQLKPNGRTEESSFISSPPKSQLLFKLTTGLIPLIIVAWWVADMIIFGIGARKSEGGCPLRQNL